MYMRRALCWLVSFCFLCSALCGVAYGAEWTSIEDMGIDPWSDLEAVQGLLRPSEEVYTIDDDVVAAIEGMEAVAPMSLPSGEYTLKIDGSEASYAVNCRVMGREYKLSNGFVADIGKGYTMLTGGSVEQNAYDMGILFYKGTYYDVTSPVTVSSAKNSKVTLTGRLSAYPRELARSGDVDTWETMASVVFSSCLLVNGDPVGEWQEGDSISFTDYELDLSEIGSITSIGIRVRLTHYSSSGISVSPKWNDGFYSASYMSFGWYVSDSLSVIADEVIPGGVDEETKGLLGSIIGWLTQIKDGIVSLPGQIVNLLLEGLKSLFVPDGQQVIDLQARYKNLFETRFGFIYQSFQMLENLWETLVGSWSSHSDYSFQFPEISFTMQGTKYVIVQSQTVSLDNELMSVLRPVVGTFFSFICVLGSVHSLETVFVAVVSGKNYFDYIHSIKEEEEDV